MSKKVPENKHQMQWWKIVVCIVGVLIIAGAITYALMSRASASTSASSGNSTTPAAAASNTPATSDPSTATIATNAPTAGGDGEMNWIKSLNSKWASNDFIFVVFPGNDDVTMNVNQTVKGALEKIRQTGTAIEVMTLSSTDPEFRPTLDRLAIQKLPAVLVLAPTGQGAIIKGDITETKILQSYLSLVKACAPGAGPGCCP